MNTALTLSSAEHLGALLPLVRAFHHEEGIASTEEHRTAALMPLLEGSPHGAVYLVGPRRAPIGYLIVTYGWSVEYGGLEGAIDELFLRPAVRGRGIAREVLNVLPRLLAPQGVKSLCLEVAADNAPARRLYTRAGYRLREGYNIMTRTL